MIFELDHWGKAFLRNDACLVAAYENICKPMNAAEESEGVFELEHCLLWFAHFARHLFEEAAQAKDPSISFNPSRPPIEKILEMAEAKLELNGCVGKGFSLNQTFTITTQELCNQLIHNKMLNWEWSGKDNRSGIYVSSDRDAKKKIYFVPISVFSDVASKIGKISISETETTNAS